MSFEGTGLKKLLIASLAGNLFLVGLGAGAGVMGLRFARERPQQRANLWQASSALSPGDRAAMRKVMRDQAVQATPDMRAASAARREAFALMQAQVYDAVAVAAALKKAREFDMNARARMDAALVDYTGKLDHQRRTLLVQGMQADVRNMERRIGRRGDGEGRHGGDGDRREGGPPPGGAPAPAQAPAK